MLEGEIIEKQQLGIFMGRRVIRVAVRFSRVPCPKIAKSLTAWQRKPPVNINNDRKHTVNPRLSARKNIAALSWPELRTSIAGSANTSVFRAVPEQGRLRTDQGR